MSYNLQEQDQIDSLRDFWSRWGTLISALVLVAGVAWAGYSGWQWWQTRQAAQASALFDHVTQEISASNLPNAAAAWAELQGHYDDSPYAQMGGLAMAKAYDDAGKANEAQAVLRWTAKHARNPSYRAAALLNLSAIEVDAKALPTALQTVQKSPSPAFAALFATRRGDIYALMGQRDKARQAYAEAMTELPPNAGYRQLVQLKLDSVGGSAS